MSNIYNIQQDLLSLFGAIEENDGEITPEIEEALSIKQEEFKDKIKSYSGIVKMLENDVNAIKEERDRLYEFQKSKEKTIERLKKIMAEAINTFGDTTKAGGKFVDYGTGKVSVKNTKTVEVDTDSLGCFIDRAMSYFKWQSDNNQMSTSLVDPKDMLVYVNTPCFIEDNIYNKDYDENMPKYTIDDIKNLNTSIDLDIPFKELISTDKGIELLDALLKYGMFRAVPKVDKKSIKDEAKGDNHFVPVYAKIVDNKSVIIK